MASARGRGRDPGVLARHFELGGEPVRAAEYLLEATRRAGRTGAYGIALHHAEHGIGLGAAGEVAAALHALAAEACHPLGRYVEGLEHGRIAGELSNRSRATIEFQPREV